MIERLYIKNYLSFEEEVLKFQEGLIVFSGPSGAGKSLLLNALLALFGYRVVEAQLSEVVLSEGDIRLDEYGYEADEFIAIKAIKKEKVRFFLNAQIISKKVLQTIFSQKIFYLHQKERDFFKSEHILSMIDSTIKEREFLQKKEEFESNFKQLQKITKELDELKAKERSQEELKEFLAFEIEKIEEVAPKVGEYEELLEIKKELSKKEKIVEAIKKASVIFEYEGSVIEALELMGKESGLFEESMNELRDIFAQEQDRLDALGEMDIEEILTRIEKLSSLKRKYGSIEAALEAKEKKREELAKIENIEFEKKSLLEQKERLKKELLILDRELFEAREKKSKLLIEEINKLLKELKLPNASIEWKERSMKEIGSLLPEVRLSGVVFEKISSGEYNRLRLAFMAAVASEGVGEGVLILDEIDANISGEESMAVAKILKRLSKKYQIFAISHQAQLSSVADQHFLVTKEEGKSKVKELQKDEKIQEIARIISGENITKEAIEFAKKLLKESR